MSDIPNQDDTLQSTRAHPVARAIALWLPPAAVVLAAPVTAHEMTRSDAEQVSNAVASRQQEFATGRWLVGQALRQITPSQADEPVGIGPLRQPLWPAGIIGSISHDGGLCAVAVLQMASHEALEQLAGIGIDLIDIATRRGKMTDIAPIFVTTAAELETAAQFALPAAPEMVLFSLKEAIIKALCGTLDDFIDMRAIHLLPDGAVTVLDNPVPLQLRARVVGGHVVTAALRQASHGSHGNFISEV